MRFPFAPLQPLIEAKWRPRDERDIEYAGITSKAARVLEVDRARVQRWMHHGLNEANADFAATRLGYHPGLVWPEWWQQAEAA